MNRLARLLTLIEGGASGGGWEADEVCPAITPTWGANVNVNADMETGDPPAGYSGGTLAAAADERTGGTGAQCLDVTSVAFSRCVKSIPTENAWVYFDGWMKKISHDSTISFTSATHTLYAVRYSSWTSWTNLPFPELCMGTGIKISLNTGLNFNTRFDDFNVYEYDFSSMHVKLGTRGQKSGTYICKPTVSAWTMCGMLIEYLDANNYVYAEVNRCNFSPATSARLISRIGGVFAVARTGAITYSAAKELKVIVSGTTHQLFYDGAQVGADVTIDNTGLGTEVHGFNTVAGNTVGLMTTNP